jgi:hypothetical protein
MLASKCGETAKIPAFDVQIIGEIIFGLGQTDGKLRRWQLQRLLRQAPK